MTNETRSEETASDQATESDEVATAEPGSDEINARALPRWAWIAGAAALMAVVALIVIVVLVGGGKTPLGDPSPSPTPSPTLLSQVFLFDDGIADDEYPPLAASRGDRYPIAYMMEEWVWDRVGPGWALSLVDASYQKQYAPPGTSVLYLVSPEGATFELFALSWAYAHSPAIVSWHEETKTAHVVSLWGEHAALFDLTTGAADPISLPMSGGPSARTQFITATSSNEELWLARDDDWREWRTFMWSPAGGFTRVMAQGDYYYEDYGLAASPDGTKAVFPLHGKDASGYASARSGQPGLPNMIIFDLSTATDTFVRITYPTWPEYCYFADWREAVLIVNCWNYDDYDEYYSVDASGNLTSVDRVPSAFEVMWSATEYTDPVSGITFTSEAGAYEAFEAWVDGPDGPVKVAEAGGQWPRSGVTVHRVVEVKPQLFRVETYESGVYLVDTLNAHMSTIRATMDPTYVGLYPGTLVYFGEATDPRRGQHDYFFGQWGH